MTAGIVQIGLQWLMFTMMYVGFRLPYSSCAIHAHQLRCRLVLYMIYYPPHLKYRYSTLGNITDEDVAYDTHDTRPLLSGTSKPVVTKSPDWWLSIVISWVVAAHLSVILSLSRISKLIRSTEFLYQLPHFISWLVYPQNPPPTLRSRSHMQSPHGQPS